MTATVARRTFLRLLERARRGEKILITRYGKPAAVIVPPKKEIES
ncbi:MAG: type II toxin-antitoxin system prevent-host-death family antitoxin [Proteobacteria bacterium]|nr:type II toxin-antitoxin system prevent-host-death family antitoxin [Pseudomonadota bacterium]